MIHSSLSLPASLAISGCLPVCACPASPTDVPPTSCIQLQGRARVENLSRSCRSARWSREQFDAIPKASQFADHLARSHLLRLFADGRPTFLVPHALVKNLPNEATESVGDRTNGLGVAEARDEPAI